jgi:hypothetical protein
MILPAPGRSDSQAAATFKRDEIATANANGATPEGSTAGGGVRSPTEQLLQPLATEDTIAEDPNEPVGPLDEQLNPFEPAINDGQAAIPLRGEEQTPGIRLGTMLLRPSISQTINTETQKFSDGKTRRNYLTTGIRGTLTTDWSRHSLTVTGDGAWENNIGRNDNGEEPRARINADLQLDLARDTIAHITAGYDFSREDTDDPNALTNASTQSGVHEFRTGLSIERDFGVLRGLAAIELNRHIYSDATALDGSAISLADRDRTGGNIRLRAGYELSPALIPFIEVSTGQSSYDQKTDDSGYRRSSHSYAAKTGTEVDLGEKLRGELALGYARKEYDDGRLRSIDALTWDGDLTWSPQRGTDVLLGLRTSIEDFAEGGESGWVSYQLDAGLTHQLRNNLIARLSGRIVRREFTVSDSDPVTEYYSGAGLTWSISRYLDLTGDISYQATPAYDSNQFRFGAGLTLKR